MRGVVLLLALIWLQMVLARADRADHVAALNNRSKVFLLILWALILTWAMWLTPAAAHMSYPIECCAAQFDCAPVPCESLASLPQGAVEYTPRSAPPKLFESSKVRPSQDSQCHVCLHGSEQSPICVFTQQGA